MKFINYIKEQFLYIFISIILIMLVAFILNGLKVDGYGIFFICSVFFVFNFIYLLCNYLDNKRYFQKINETLDSLDEKYLLSELIESGNNQVQKNIFSIIKQCNKSMTDKVSEIERENREYREFVELWVHEVKIPIASSKFIIENNKSNISYSLKEEINKIDDYVEKALYYARSGSVEKDYIIKKLNLETLVNSAIKRDAHYLIQKSCKILKDNLSFNVYTDEKWIMFIIHQIISNSIKYFNKDNNTLSFSGKCERERIILNIGDNGIGMDEEAVNRAFEKGFTGQNGRIFKKSTGMGLYLSKKLCKRLGIEIYIKSKLNEGTNVSIIFPKESMINDVIN